MAYIEIEISIPENRLSGSDITIAELSSAEFESFLETESGLKAYILEENFKPEKLKSITVLSSSEFGKSSYISTRIEESNWNKIWESEYEPVSIPGFCFVRSPFHQSSGEHKHEIVIEPKMSFGTGHHETTWLMINMMENIEFSDKEVLDVGCGTGVLSIMASKLNASSVCGIDIDSWAYENSIENLDVNNITNGSIILGDINAVKGNKYDIILANITRNILLDDMEGYSKLCKPESLLLLSGFYSEDLEIIKSKALTKDFKYIDHITKNNWVSVLFKQHE